MTKFSNWKSWQLFQNSKFKIQNWAACSLVLSTITLLPGCTNTSSKLPTAQLTLADQTFQVEIAATPTTRERGLMARTKLAANAGMLFVFESPQQVSFWMKDTPLPLDILYFSADRKLRQLYASTPPCQADPCANYPSAAADILYALELPAGTATHWPVKLGDAFTLSQL